VSKFDKLLARFLLKPKDFSYTELRRLLKKFGYDEFQKGKLPVLEYALYTRNQSIFFNFTNLILKTF